jgi:hypothetical protein
MIAKVPATPVQIPAKLTLTLSASTVMLILDALGEKPYKVAGPAIAEIEPQILAQQVTEGRTSENDARSAGVFGLDSRGDRDLSREGEKGQSNGSGQHASGGPLGS